jgi:hypothetical protein
VAVYATWRGDRVLRERAAAVERGQAQAQRRLAASRLLALQAQVEPQLLFDALSRLLALLERAEQHPQVPARSERGSDVLAQADALLEDLIALLRLSLARDDQQASTLARERALVQAIARVMDERALLPPRLQWLLDDDSGEAALAPMWLSTLLRTLAAGSGPAAAWIASARRDGERVRLVILATAGDLVLHHRAGDAVDATAIERSLRDVHGEGVRVERGGAADLLWRIEWPCPVRP